MQNNETGRVSMKRTESGMFWLEGIELKKLLPARPELEFLIRGNIEGRYLGKK
jgi:hypothetical protein